MTAPHRGGGSPTPLLHPNSDTGSWVCPSSCSGTLSEVEGRSDPAARHWRRRSGQVQPAGYVAGKGLGAESPSEWGNPPISQCAAGELELSGARPRSVERLLTARRCWPLSELGHRF